MQKQQIKNIIFDLGNIIVDVDYKRVTDAMSWDYDTFMRFYASDFFREFEIGKRSEEELFIELNKYIPLQAGDEKCYRDNIHLAFPLRPRTWAKVHWLRRHYRIFLFSNTNSLDFDGVNAWINLAVAFHGAYVSHKEACLKPQPQAYSRVEEMFHIYPQQTLFVDDRQENIEGALKAGWHAELIENEARLFEVLDEYNV
jgi:glucose-1-phosphatase